LGIKFKHYWRYLSYNWSKECLEIWLLPPAEEEPSVELEEHAQKHEGKEEVTTRTRLQRYLDFVTGVYK
jgi:hypothetical protein